MVLPGFVKASAVAVVVVVLLLLLLGSRSFWTSVPCEAVIEETETLKLALKHYGDYIQGLNLAGKLRNLTPDVVADLINDVTTYLPEHSRAGCVEEWPPRPEGSASYCYVLANA
jgi:hypothetical protein